MTLSIQKSQGVGGDTDMLISLTVVITSLCVSRSKYQVYTLKIYNFYFSGISQ